ncbi:MAG: universal stress protein [Saprospiraceae bacterium]|nr:universal stress protein [Saprospiraceae bacterium]
MKKILVPIDFSETSMNAFQYAIALFGTTAAEFTLLHTYKASTRAFHMISIDKVMKDDAEREMDALVEKLQTDHTGVSFQTKIVKSDPISTITSLGNTGKYDYLLMGTKGATGLREVFMGSVAGGVISRTSAPVMVIPAGCIFESLTKITFAVSNNPFSATTVKPLRDLTEEYKSRISVVHVTDEKDSQIENILKPIQDLDPIITYAFGEGKIAKHLESHLQKQPTQMLCMIRSKRGFFDRIFGESVTMKQTFNSPVPLLILHE